MASDDIISFLRTRDYRLERFLDKGKGATGETALLKDDDLEMLFVCKKYVVDDVLRRQEYFDRFVDEVRLLFRAFHPCIVRIFSCYLYPKARNGFIIMEYIDGTDLRSYLEGNPDQINSLFMQAISAFEHLEEQKILHRDVRTSNLMVTNDGILKVIDFGFGKSIETSEGFGKSITLNWEASEPKEFENHIYDFCTECYFVGKLFQKIITELNLDTFRYDDTLRHMVEYDPHDRIKSFHEILQSLRSETSSVSLFTPEDREVYRSMADFLQAALIELHYPVSFQEDTEKIITSLNAIAKSSQLENIVIDELGLIRTFVTSAFVRRTNCDPLFVPDLQAFLELFQSKDSEGRKIILSNLWSRFKTLPVSDPDDLPF